MQEVAGCWVRVEWREKEHLLFVWPLHSAPNPSLMCMCLSDVGCAH